MEKYIIVFVLCVLGLTLSQAELDKAEMVKEFMEFADQCMAETGATKNDLNDIINKKPAAGMEGKCLRSCIFKKYKVLDDNGKFVKSVALEHAKLLADGDAKKMEIGEKITETCSALAVPDDHCEAAEAYGKCLKEQAVAHGVDKMDF